MRSGRERGWRDGRNPTNEAVYRTSSTRGLGLGRRAGLARDRVTSSRARFAVPRSTTSSMIEVSVAAVSVPMTRRTTRRGDSTRRLSRIAAARCEAPRARHHWRRRCGGRHLHRRDADLVPHRHRRDDAVVPRARVQTSPGVSPGSSRRTAGRTRTAARTGPAARHRASGPLDGADVAGLHDDVGERQQAVGVHVVDAA